MKIAIVSDAWRPQINGVVTTLGKTAEAAERLGHTVEVISADGSASIACPSYPEIRLAIRPGRLVRQRLRQFAPEMIHIATEGPLGLAARNHCVRSKLTFTTSYHTQFPDYANARWGVPASWGYSYLRWFHKPAVRTLVGTETVRTNLHAWGFSHLVPWSRGVDTTLFRPDPQARAMANARWPRPIMLYSGRVAVEKNLEAFLRLQLPGTKLIVGDGPARATLQSRYPDAVFLGYRFGAELAWHMAAADVFVFPSRTDTFGIVMLEAMACGVPVAAYPVQGPLDVVRDGVTGVLDEDLASAVQRALRLDTKQCRAFAQLQSWERCTRQFIGHLAPACERPALQRLRAQDQGAAVAQLKKG
ncbi:MAG TPA: glycosyltransferase family 1 protein [Steroidobacteraceae bacterium]|jgi:glycosyltransferase involved in cell wall biosynthesis|nr:glycosyltransferase family 1 protein [Steroidobacteraceae bacterium]